MSKNTELTEQTEVQQQTQEIVADEPVAGPTSYITDLMKNGTTILTSNSRDGLTEMINEIPADVHYSVGAVGFQPATGVFSLRVDIINY